MPFKYKFRNPKSKFSAKPTVVDGIRFDSQLEARYYKKLLLRKKAGEVNFFLRQVPLHLPGGTKLVIDFLEFHSDGHVHFVDTKGILTEAAKIKIREVEHHYPIEIELVKKA